MAKIFPAVYLWMRYLVLMTTGLVFTGQAYAQAEPLYKDMGSLKYSTKMTLSVDQELAEQTTAGQYVKQTQERFQQLRREREMFKESPETLAVLREEARKIKADPRYPEDKARVEGIIGTRISCYGAMCQSDWPVKVAERLLDNPTYVHCYWAKDGRMRCGPSEPDPALLYSANIDTADDSPKADTGAAAAPSRERNFSWMELGCPMPHPDVYKDDLAPDLMRGPYLACWDSLCQRTACITCESSSPSEPGLTSNQSPRLCPAAP